MRPTQKFTQTLNGEQTPNQKVGSGNSTTQQQTNPPTPQQEHRTVLLAKIRGLLGWAYDKSNPQTNISNN